MATVKPVNVSFKTEKKHERKDTEKARSPGSRNSKFKKRIPSVPSKVRYKPEYEERIDDLLRIEKPVVVQKRIKVDSTLAEKLLTTLSRRQREFEMWPSIRKKLAEEIRSTDRRNIKNIVIKHKETIKKLIESLRIDEELFEDEFVDDEDLTYMEERETLIRSLLAPLETRKTSDVEDMEEEEAIEEAKEILDELKTIKRPISRESRREFPSKKPKTSDVISIIKRFPKNIKSEGSISSTHIQPWKSIFVEKKITIPKKKEKRIELDMESFDENLRQISKKESPIEIFLTKRTQNEWTFQHIPEPETSKENDTRKVDLNYYMRDMYKRFIKKKIQPKTFSSELKKSLGKKPHISRSIKHLSDEDVAFKSFTVDHPKLLRSEMSVKQLNLRFTPKLGKPRSHDTVKHEGLSKLPPKLHEGLTKFPTKLISHHPEKTIEPDIKKIVDEKNRIKRIISITEEKAKRDLLSEKQKIEEMKKSLKDVKSEVCEAKVQPWKEEFVEKKEVPTKTEEEPRKKSEATSFDEKTKLIFETDDLKKETLDFNLNDYLKNSIYERPVGKKPVKTIEPDIKKIVDEKNRIKRLISITEEKAKRDLLSEKQKIKEMKKSPKDVKSEVCEGKVQPWKEEFVEKKEVLTKTEEEPRIKSEATSFDEKSKSIFEIDDLKKETLDFNLNDYLKNSIYERPIEKKVRPKSSIPVPKSVLKQKLRIPFVRRTDVNLFAYKSVYVEGPMLSYSELMRKQLELNLRLKTKLMELASQDAIPRRLQHQGLTKFPSKLIRYHISETLQKEMKRPYTIATSVRMSQNGIEHVRALSDYWVQKLIPRTRRSVSIVRKKDFSQAEKMKKESLANYVVPAWRRQCKSFMQKTDTVSSENIKSSKMKRYSKDNESIRHFHESDKEKIILDDAEKMKKRVLETYYKPINTTRYRGPNENILVNLKNNLSLEKKKKIVKKYKNKSKKKKVVLESPEIKLKKCESVHNVLRKYFLKKNVTGKYLIINLDNNEKNIDKMKLRIGEECELHNNWIVISFESVEEELTKLIEESRKGKQEINGGYCIEFLKKYISQKIAKDFYAKHFALGQINDEIIDKINVKLDPLIRTFYEEYENVNKLLQSGSKRKPRNKLLLKFLLNSIVNELSICIKSEEYLKQPEKIIIKVEIMMKEILQSFLMDYVKLLKKVNNLEAERKVIIFETFQCCLISKVTEILRPMFEKKRLASFLENWQFQMQYILTEVTNKLIEEEPIFGLPLNDIDLHFSKVEDTSPSDSEAESMEVPEKNKDMKTLFIEAIIHKCFEKVFIQKLTQKIREIFPSLSFGKPGQKYEPMKYPDLRIETCYEDIRAQKGFLTKVKRRSNVDKETLCEDSSETKELELIERTKNIIEKGLPDIVQRLVQKKRKKTKRTKKLITTGTTKDVKCVPVVNLELFKKDLHLSRNAFFGTAEDIENMLNSSATFSDKWLARRLAIDLTVLIPYPVSDMLEIIQDCSQCSKDILRNFLLNSSFLF